MFMVSAPRREAAVAKLIRVRVEWPEKARWRTVLVRAAWPISSADGAGISWKAASPGPE